MYPFLRTASGKKFSQFSQVDVEILDEGDMLFIPAFWFHTFTHLGPVNINVNFWWRPERQLLNGLTAREAFLATLPDVLFAGRAFASSAEALAAIRSLDPATVSLVQALEQRILDAPPVA